jgi:hypothetical protein
MPEETENKKLRDIHAAQPQVYHKSRKKSIGIEPKAQRLDAPNLYLLLDVSNFR